MNKNMKDNINLEGNSLYFADTTYGVEPPQNSRMKLFIILAYDEKINKILICALSLIYNENLETFKTIFKFLKTIYNFKPKLFTIDLGKAKTIANIFYHFSIKIFYLKT